MDPAAAPHLNSPLLLRPLGRSANKKSQHRWRAGPRATPHVALSLRPSSSAAAGKAPDSAHCDAQYLPQHVSYA